jgi:hypothetical protein
LDAVTGDRIINNDWSWYLKDITRSNYRSDLSAFIVSNLDTNGSFDGVYLDDVWSAITASEFHRDDGCNPPPSCWTDPTLPSSFVSGFNSGMESLLTTIKTGIGDHLIIINANWSSTNLLALVDGQLDENFAHANWEGPTEFLSTSSWLNHLAALQAAAAGNKYYLAQSGVLDGATDVQLEQLVKYTYASFLMGIPSNNTYAKHYFTPSIDYDDHYWYDIWDVDLGDPTGDKRVVPRETNIFVREFDNGKVYVNPTDISSDVIQLGTVYKSYDKDGNSINTSHITLAPRTGVILENSPVLGTAGYGSRP